MYNRLNNYMVMNNFLTDSQDDSRSKRETGVRLVASVLRQCILFMRNDVSKYCEV